MPTYCTCTTDVELVRRSTIRNFPTFSGLISFISHSFSFSLFPFSFCFLSFLDSMDTYIARLKERYDSSASNKSMLMQEDYDRIVAALRGSSSTPLSKKEKRTASRYSLETYGTEWCLRKMPGKKIVIPVESYFDVIKRTHEELGHGGRDAVLNEIQKTYANIGQREITLFINLCQQCQLKALKVNKKVTSKPLLEEDYSVYLIYNM